MKIRIKLEKENLFCLLALWIWGQTILLSFCRAIIMRLPIIGTEPDMILTGVFIALILLAIPSYRINGKDVLFLFAVIAVFLCEMVFYARGQLFLDEYLINFVIKVLPLYIVGVSLSEADDKGNIIWRMYILSIITLFLSLLYSLAIATPMTDAQSKYVGNMYFAYNLLPHCCLIACYTTMISKIFSWSYLLNLACTIMSGFYLLMLGCRGAACIYLILVATLIILRGKIGKGIIIKIGLTGCAIALIVSDAWYIVVLWMYDKAQQLGLSIRIFDKLLTETFSLTSGRNLLAQTLWRAIEEKPLLGNGLCSDRIITNGSYAHNIALELWVEFGLIAGTIMLIAIIFVMLRGYLSAKQHLAKQLILALIFASFFKLFLSGSYLDEPLLFLLLGMCVGCIRKSNMSTPEPIYNPKKAD